jgi:hypothetical protein
MKPVHVLCYYVADSMQTSTISSLYLKSAKTAKTLRIGVLANGYQLIAAFRKVITDILASNFARVELLVLNDNATQSVVAPQGPSFPVRAFQILMDSQRRLTGPVGVD